MKQIIIQYLVDYYKDSLLCYEVNGTPEKRLFRLEALAVHTYNKMSKWQKIKLFIKILMFH